MNRLSHVLTSLVVAGLLTGCGVQSVAPTSMTTGLRADGSVSATVNGVTVTGSAGAVLGTSLDIRPVVAPSEAVLLLTRLGTGVDVVLGPGTTIGQNLTLSWPTPDVVGTEVPVVAHQLADGSWELIPTKWDGKVATVQASRFSPYVLGWFQPAKVWDWVSERGWTFLTGHRTQPACKTKAPSWLTLQTISDVVQVCVIDQGDHAQVTIGSLRDYWLQVDAPAAEGVNVPEQFLAFRRALGGALSFDPLHTVLLPPGGTMSFVVQRRDTNYSMQVNAGVTYRTTAINGLTALLLAAQVPPSIAKGSSGLELLFDCGGDYLKSYVENKSIIDPDKFRDVLLCSAMGGLGNLAVPEKAVQAVRDRYGAGLDAQDAKVQGEIYASQAGKLQNFGIVLQAVGLIGAARDAIIAAFAPLSDAIQDLASKGGASAVTIVVKGTATVKVIYAAFIGGWRVHGGGLTIEDAGSAEAVHQGTSPYATHIVYQWKPEDDDSIRLTVSEVYIVRSSDNHRFTDKELRAQIAGCDTKSFEDLQTKICFPPEVERGDYEIMTLVSSSRASVNRFAANGALKNRYNLCGSGEDNMTGWCGA